MFLPSHVPWASSTAPQLHVWGTSPGTVRGSIHLAISTSSLRLFRLCVVIYHCRLLKDLGSPRRCSFLCAVAVFLFSSMTMWSSVGPAEPCQILDPCSSSTPLLHKLLWHCPGKCVETFEAIGATIRKSNSTSKATLNTRTCTHTVAGFIDNL